MRYLKRIVLFCIGFAALSYVAAFVCAWNGVDVSYILTGVNIVFGGELLMTCVLKIYDKSYTPPSKTSATTAKPPATKPTNTNGGVG